MISRVRLGSPSSADVADVHASPSFSRSRGVGLTRCWGAQARRFSTEVDALGAERRDPRDRALSWHCDPSCSAIRPLAADFIQPRQKVWTP
jgi:hypothetical protein